jgi:hypothetical protein
MLGVVKSFFSPQVCFKLTHSTQTCIARFTTSSLNMAASQKINTAHRIVGFDKNLWVEYSALAIEAQAINLGQVSCIV